MVICRKCNCGYDEKYGVCPNCGTPYQQYTENIAAASNKSKSGLIAVISISAVVLIGIFIALIIIFSQPNTQSQLNEQISLGEKYLTEENYEEAIVAFKKAIEIEPNAPELYIKLADAYVAKGDTANAISILQEGYEKTQSEIIKTKLDGLTNVGDEVIIEESSEISEEPSTISEAEQEKAALQEYENNMEKSIKINKQAESITCKVSQYEIADLNNDGSYELITQYKLFFDSFPSYAYGVYLKIFKYHNGEIEEYKTFDSFENTLSLGGQLPNYYWYISELYIDKSTKNYIILTRSVVEHGSSPADYEYIYTKDVLSDSGFSRTEKWSMEYRCPSIEDYSYMKDCDIAIFGENDYRGLYFKIDDQSVNKTEYIDNLNRFNSSASICDKYHIDSNEINEPPYNTKEIIDVKNLKYITYDEFLKKYNRR